MAVSNKERVGRALDQFRLAWQPYQEQEMRAIYDDAWLNHLPEESYRDGQPVFDTQALLKTLIANWDEVFGQRLNRDVLNLAHGVRKTRNKHAHDEAFETDDAYSALHEIQKLIEAISAPQAEEVEKAKVELLRQKFEEQARREQRKASTVTIEGAVLGGLKPWREVIAPHEDVARGTFQQAEFAADLWQVFQGQGTMEYRDPTEFFRRTFLTEGLRELLVNAIKRMEGVGGDPVVELQINFGGGKTHSMLAAYHLLSGVKVTDLPGLEGVIADSGVAQPRTARRAVLVGNSLTPGAPAKKEDGTVVNTLWGELAWQLGGRAAYDLVREADETATNPGGALDAVFAMCGPCLILIDEWVAYARQLFGREKMLPAGSFDTQFTFAQTLCEAARRAPSVLVMVSIPASVSMKGSPTAITVAQQGDIGGQAALDSLKQAVGRSNLVWRPATSDESFEIVRRRLFQTVADPRHRDAVVKAFMDMYRANPQEFPTECREVDYERRMKAAYPIHPELFDRLYSDWSTLEKFQRTRGVLRLMASAIHSLWKRDDRSVLILPASVPIDDPTVQPELTRYLDDRWAAVIDKDLDRPHSEPLAMDSENVNFGRYSACRRVARTVFLGSAPTLRAAAQGIEDKRIKLGCAQPGEAVATFGDALRKLSDGRTTYLYVNGTRYWYDVQPSVNKTARDMAEREEIKQGVELEVVKRLKLNTRNRGDFGGVHVAVGSHDVPDDRTLRLVVLGPKHLHKQGNLTSSGAVAEANDLLKWHGSGQRNCRNTVVFLACDQGRYPELDQEVRLFLAWSYIVEKREELDLAPNNLRQAVKKVEDFNKNVDQKIGELYQWVLVPDVPPAGSDSEVIARWEDFRIQGADPLAVRVSKKLKNDQVLTSALGGNVLRHEIERIPLWRGDQVTVAQLEDDYSKYLYLSRLTGTNVLHAAIRDCVSRLTDGLAYADAYDEATNTYQNLRAGVFLEPSRPLTGMLVKSEIADLLLAAASAAPATTATASTGPAAGPDLIMAMPGALTAGTPVVYPNGGSSTAGRVTEPPRAPAMPQAPTRFHGTISLDPQTLSTGAGKVSKEVVQHLLSLLGTDVKVTIEIDAESAEGFPDNVVRTVLENCRVLKFGSHGFEAEE